jgi:Arc/MetJ-type ribon-helix-helix transcriptional regulator
MAQVVSRLPDGLLHAVDALVEQGVVASRSDAVRLGLEGLVDRHRRAEIGAAIVEGYRRMPQTDEELAGADAAGRRMIAEEPW